MYPLYFQEPNSKKIYLYIFITYIYKNKLKNKKKHHVNAEKLQVIKNGKKNSKAGANGENKEIGINSYTFF